MIYITTVHIATGAAIIATAPTVGALASGVSGGIFAILLIHIRNPVTYIRGTLIYKPGCNIRAFNPFKSVYLLIAMRKSLFITGQPCTTISGSGRVLWVLVLAARQ
jgi:hypothetical protein